MLKHLIEELLDHNLIEVTETGEIEVLEDAPIYAVKDLGFDEIHQDRICGVGYHFDGDSLYLHSSQHSTLMSEEALYDPGVGLR